MSLSIGTRLGPYEIVGPLGAGGMGEVYRARDTRLGRAVAIKTVNTPFTERFEREARAISALNHPHVCTLYDVGSFEGTGYLVMELVEGEPLRGPMPWKEAARHVAAVCDALDAAHRKGIVQKLLAKDPAERYQHADDVAVDLRALGREAPQPSAAVPHAPTRPAPKRRWLWPTLGVALLGTVAAFGALQWRAPHVHAPLPSKVPEANEYFVVPQHTAGLASGPAVAGEGARARSRLCPRPRLVRIHGCPVDRLRPVERHVVAVQGRGRAAPGPGGRS